MARRSVVVDSIDRGPLEPTWPRAEFVTAALAILCFINAIPNKYCEDGVPIVRDNVKVQAPDQWGAIWTTDYWSQTKDATPHRDLLYRPAALSSYRLIRQIAGSSPLPQLAFNVLLHAICTALVARLARRLKGSEAAALVAGTLFAVLPIHTEVIDNVVGRADLLATLGVLLALIWHRRSMNATKKRHIIGWRGAAAMAAFLAMGSKESGVAVLPMIVLMDGLWYKPWRAASRDRQWWSVGAMLRFSYLLIPALAYFFLRYAALEGRLFQAAAPTKTVNVLVDAAMWQHWLGVMQLWGMYWFKTFWPKVLCVNYTINSIRLATSFADWYVLVGVFTSLVLAVVTIRAWRRKSRGVAYLVAAMIICYLPTSNAFVLMQVFFAERVWYLSSVWLTILVGLWLAPYVSRPMWAIAVAVPMFIMAERCWIRNAEWQHNATLYAAAYRDHPEGVGVLRHYGASLVNQGEYEEGIKQLQRALEIDGGFTGAHRAIGQSYRKAGNYAAALSHLQIAAMQVPGHPPTEEALELLGRLLTVKHEPELIELTKQAERRPYDPHPEIQLVRRLRDLGQLDAALDRLSAAESRFTKSLAWQWEYAVTLVYRNDRDAAIDRYRVCMELDNKNAQLAVELAMLLFERRGEGDLNAAWELAKHAGQIAPRSPTVLVCRAELLALQGDVAAAVRLYDQAIRGLDPNSRQRRIFEERARALGK